MVFVGVVVVLTKALEAARGDDLLAGIRNFRTHAVLERQDHGEGEAAIIVEEALVAVLIVSLGALRDAKLLGLRLVERAVLLAAVEDVVDHAVELLRLGTLGGMRHAHRQPQHQSQQRDTRTT